MRGLGWEHRPGSACQDLTWGGPLAGLFRCIGARELSENRSNWAGNYTYKAARLHYPETIEQVQELVSRAGKLKALGSRHSFNDIADSPGDLISLDRFQHVPEVDRERRTVTVAANVRYGQLCGQLDREGYALHNLASLPHISIAGACAT